MQPRIVFDKSLRETYGDGKYFVYRAINEGEYLPYATTYSNLYVDTDPVVGSTNNYLYKFVTGARDTPLYGPITHYIPIPPTPTPTCAYYLYDYSHQLYHPNVSVNNIIGGNYTYKKTSDGVIGMENDSSRSTIMYLPLYRRWYVISKTTAACIITTSGAVVLYLGSASNRTSSLDKQYTINTGNTVTLRITSRYIIINNRSYRFYWNSQKTGGVYYYRTWDWWRRRYVWRRNSVLLFDDLTSVPQSYFKSLPLMSANMYISDVILDPEDAPPDTWSQGRWWKIDLGGIPTITCFRPTPTPTAIPIEPPPTPTPTPYPVTPTATPVPLPTYYFITEWDEPLLTEAGDYILPEWIT